jgi:hypothetical protein
MAILKSSMFTNTWLKMSQEMHRLHTRWLDDVSVGAGIMLFLIGDER